MSIGFIGTGAITTAIVSGLRSAGNSEPIFLSPRNAEVAARLAAVWPDVVVAVDNQQVLDAAQTVFLAVRPPIAGEVIGALRFRPEHHVVSLIAGAPLNWLRAATAPARAVTRAVPLPTAAWRAGPIAYCPASEKAMALLSQVGTAIPLSDEGEFTTFTAVTAIMASYFAAAATVSDWMAGQGIAMSVATTYVADILAGLGGAAQQTPGIDFGRLCEEYQTKGGLNEQVLAAMRDAGALDQLTDALDRIARRLNAGEAARPA